MKKSALLALACAALVSGSAFAQAAPEVKYVEDPTQGYTFNRFKDNWFITAEGGVNVVFGKTDKTASFGDRIAPAFGIQAGKWFSPLMGFRGGITYLGQKGAANTTVDVWGLTGKDGGGLSTFEKDGKTYYNTHVAQLGINFDAMLNITNWWCGYKPNRVYNFIAYVGGAGYFGMQHKLTKDLANDGWDTDNFDTSLALRGGIINSFNVSKQVALSLDIRYTAISCNKEHMTYNRISNNVAALIGVTYLFNQRTWNAPIVPVVDVTAYQNQVAVAQEETRVVEQKLTETKKKLDECMRRPVQQVAAAQPCIAPLATVYFPIGSSTVSRTDRNVLKSVAATMKADTNVHYDVCGWADNYTGSEAINNRLRTNRANAVKNILVANGVNAGQLNVITNPGDRYSGKDNVYLDRCVTIQAK